MSAHKLVWTPSIPRDRARTTWMHYSKCRWYWGDNGLQVICADLISPRSSTASSHLAPEPRRSEPPNLRCTTCAHANSVFTFPDPQSLPSAPRWHPVKTHLLMFLDRPFHVFVCASILAVFSHGERCRKPGKERTVSPKGVWNKAGYIRSGRYRGWIWVNGIWGK